MAARIKIKVSLGGVNFNHVPGDVVDWEDEADAARLVEAGFAVYEGEAPKRRKASTVETDDAADAETDAATPAPSEQKAKRGRGKAKS